MASRLTQADVAPAAKVTMTGIRLEPAKLTSAEGLILHGSEDLVQMLVTLECSDGMLRDGTTKALYKSENPLVAEVVGGKLVPRGDGTTKLTVQVASAEHGSVSASATVRVEQYAVPHAINFTNDVVPVLSKYGCNAGGCHGKALGQNGFKLSLLGFDPQADYDALVKEGHGRRVFPASPDRSLLLSKPSGQVIHGGGKKFDKDSAPYMLLRRWIEQGLPMGLQTDPTIKSIAVTPAERIMRGKTSQQLRVVATYSDGSTKDVTSETQFQSQQPDIVVVNDGGQVRTLNATGEAAVMVRYMGLVEVARVTAPYGIAAPETAYADFKGRNFIDDLAMKKWRKLGLAPSARCGDEEFIRRASLDAIGTLPTPQEIRDFVADTAPEKRDRLVDRLLARNEYASYWAVQWGDLLRNKRRYGDGYKRGTYAFAAWIRDAFQQNMPYDKFVTAILTAQGNVSDNPPTVWYREVRNATHQVNDTAQLFLGTRINCANCHHHPYERWSQDDYWGMAAFFARMGSKQGDFANETAVFVRKDGGVNQPRTGKSMKPKPLGGPEFDYARGEDPRQKLVEWMTKKENPYFGPAIANRLWAHFMGVGLVDAVDDMRVTNPPSNPELLAALANDFVDHGYDLKHLLRTIMTSGVYSLSSQPNEYNAKDKRNYARYSPKRMSAEVLADAIDAVTGSPEKFGGFPVGTRAIDLPDEGVGSYFLDVFGRSQRETPCECERSYAPNLAQILHLMNSNEVHGKIYGGGSRVAKMTDGKKPEELAPEPMVEELYLSAFGRLPKQDELKDAAEYVRTAADKRRALGDLVWVTLNSKEFLFNH